MALYFPVPRSAIVLKFSILHFPFFSLSCFQACDAITEASEHWFRYLSEALPVDTASRSAPLKNVTHLVQALTADLQQGCVGFSEMFSELLSPKGAEYSAVVFEVYEREVCAAARDGRAGYQLAKNTD